MWIIIFLLLLLVQLNVCMYVCINVSNSQEHNPEYFLNKNSKQAKSLNSRESLDSQESKFLPTEQYLLVGVSIRVSVSGSCRVEVGVFD